MRVDSARSPLWLALCAVVVLAGCGTARHGHHHPQGRHGNPPDMDRYIARMESAERAEWQQPDRVVEALGVSKGDVVCDIGAGPGYFSLRLARRVGAGGRVFAVDVEPAMIGALRDRLARENLRNVVPVLALPDDPLLPDATCDLVLVVNTYHHFPDAPAYLQRLARALAPGGRLANLDFHARELPVGPPVEHKVAREDFLADAEGAGLTLAAEHTFLPYQYFLVLQRSDAN